MASTRRAKTEDLTAEIFLRALADLDPVPAKGDSLTCEGVEGKLRLSVSSGPWSGQVTVSTSAWLPPKVTISRKSLLSFLSRAEGPLKIMFDSGAVAMSAGRKRIKLAVLPVADVLIPVPNEWFPIGDDLAPLQLLSKFAVADEILPELMLIRIKNGEGFATNRVSAVRVPVRMKKAEAVPAAVVKHLTESFSFNTVGESFTLRVQGEAGLALFSYQMPETGGLTLDRVRGMLDAATEWPKKISFSRDKLLEALEMLSKAEAEVSTFSMQKKGQEVLLSSGNEKMEMSYELDAVVRADCDEVLLLHPVLGFVKMEEGSSVHIRWQGEDSAYAVQVDNHEALLLTPRRA